MSAEAFQPSFDVLSLEHDLTWIYLLILSQAKHAALDMLVAESEHTHLEPFFSFKGALSETDQQMLDIDWPSLPHDAAVFKEMLLQIATEPATSAETIKQLLLTTSLGQALASPTILVTAEQVNEVGQQIKPLDHIIKVAGFLESTHWLLPEDELVLRVTKLRHDDGKMGAVHFLPEHTLADTAELRKELEKKYNNLARHTHPKHAYMGVLILQKILTVLANDPANHEIEPLRLFIQKNSDAATLFLNVVFHHHHFLYGSEVQKIPLADWFVSEVTNYLLPTLPPDRPDLIIRFMMLLAEFRLADIAATPAHHRHWPKNKWWFQQVPDIFRKMLPVNDLTTELIERLEKLVTALPNTIETKASLGS